MRSSHGVREIRDFITQFGTARRDLGSALVICLPEPDDEEGECGREPGSTEQPRGTPDRPHRAEQDSIEEEKDDGTANEDPQKYAFTPSCPIESAGAGAAAR